MRKAVYPGSFDPLTNGHVNIIERGLALFDELTVAVAKNMHKQPMFTVDERIQMIRDAFPSNARLKVESFDGLLVNFAKERDCNCILRGLRAVADFEFEYQMANMNRNLDDQIDTVFLMANPSNFYVSSRLVKEVAILGGDINAVVPEHVRVLLTERIRNNP